jgi:hypothetical protein
MQILKAKDRRQNQTASGYRQQREVVLPRPYASGSSKSTKAHTLHTANEGGKIRLRCSTGYFAHSPYIGRIRERARIAPKSNARDGQDGGIRSTSATVTSGRSFPERKQDWTRSADATSILLTQQSGIILLLDLGYWGTPRHIDSTILTCRPLL